MTNYGRVQPGARPQLAAATRTLLADLSDQAGSRSCPRCTQPETGRNALDAGGVAGVALGAAIEDALPGILQAGGEILERALEKVLLASDLPFHQRWIKFRTEEDV